MPDRCTSNPQQNRCTCQTGESRDQWGRNQYLPQFSSHHNCLHCAGDHETKDCETRQRQTLTTNNPASGTGTSTHKMHQTHQIHLHIPTQSHQPAINTVSLLYMCKHQPLTSTLHIFNPTHTKFLPHHLHK